MRRVVLQSWNHLARQYSRENHGACQDAESTQPSTQARGRNKRKEAENLPFAPPRTLLGSIRDLEKGTQFMGEGLELVHLLIK